MNYLKVIFLTFIVSFSNLQAQQKFHIHENIPYKSSESKTSERCHLMIRSPKDPGSYPVIVWFHGGGLSSGEAYFPEDLLDLQAVIVAVNYRLYPQASVSECIDDAAASIAWTFQHINEYSGDTQKMIVAGHSAGGYLTSMLGLDKKYLEKYQIDANDIYALFPFSGHAITHFTERKSRGISGTQVIVDEMAPIFHIRKDASPIYLLCGDRELELLGRYEENAYMWRMLKVIGHEDCHLYEFDGHGHSPMVAPGCHVLSEFVKNIH